MSGKRGVSDSLSVGGPGIVSRPDEMEGCEVNGC